MNLFFVVYSIFFESNLGYLFTQLRTTNVGQFRIFSNFMK